MMHSPFPATLVAKSCLIALAALLAGCSDRVAGGGDATETGNALAGDLVLEGGAAATGALVALVPAGYHPAYGEPLPDALLDTADSRGRYGFRAPAPGRYNVEALHPATGRRAFIRGIEFAGDTVEIPREPMRVPGALAFARPDWLPREGGILYVPGSTRLVRLEQARRDGQRAVFDSLPAGTLPEVRYAQGGTDTSSLRMVGDVTVRPGVTAAVHPFAAWTGMARVVLNTSATGVAISRPLTAFPLLVRLAAPAFDPASASADGRDLRFAKPDGTPLPFAIESWGDSGALAWVRMDTVHAGESGQHILAHWGNTEARAPIGLPPVFDTAAGFAGVWRLGEGAPDTAADGLYRDATQAGSHADDRVSSTANPGVIGRGATLDSGDYIQAPRASDVLRLPRGFTLSAWFRSHATQGVNGGEMISVGDNYGLRLSRDGRLHVFFWPETPPSGSQDPWYLLGSQGADFLDGQWHLAQGVFDGAALRLYLDGQELGLLAVPGPVDFKFPINVTLGKHGNGKAEFNYRGDLDEVQVHARARGLDWHKLSFENQKPGSGFPALVQP